MPGLAVEIAARAQTGRNRFEIRLDPPELGRIDVRLDVDRSGHVTSRLVVEKAETLDLLRRDAPELERALQQAGLKTSDNGLQFTLRDQAFAGRDQGHPAPNAARLAVADADLAPIETVAGGYGPFAAAATAASIFACEEPQMADSIIPAITPSVTAAVEFRSARPQARPAWTRTRWRAISRPS